LLAENLCCSRFTSFPGERELIAEGCDLKSQSASPWYLSK
jgi:hypothetical protein